MQCFYVTGAMSKCPIEQGVCTRDVKKLMQSLYVGGIMTNVELGKVCAQRTLKMQCLYVAGNLLKRGVQL